MPNIKIQMCVSLLENENIDDFKPFKAHSSDAAFDLINAEEEEVVLAPNERKLFSAGFKMELPIGWEAQIRPRSGNALKKGITVLNTPGTIDANYRGVVGVILYNSSKNESQVIKRGDKIAQMVIQRVEDVSLQFGNVDVNTDRGEGGFGSTDKK